MRSVARTRWMTPEVSSAPTPRVGGNTVIASGLFTLVVALVVTFLGGCGAPPNGTSAVNASNPDQTGTPDAAASPTPAERPAFEPMAFPGCEAVQRERHYCLTMANSEIALLGLDSGRFCKVGTTTAPSDDTFLVDYSMVWAGEAIYRCSIEGLLRIVVADSSWEVAGYPCDGVAGYAGGLLVKRAGVFDPLEPYFAPLSWYPDYEAVRREVPARTFSLDEWSVENMAVQGSRLYTVTNVGSSVEVSDLDAQRRLGVLTLEDYNGEILSLSVTADGYLVLTGGPWGEDLQVFDAYDGRLVNRHEVPPDLSGLACVAGHAPPPHDTPTPTPTGRPPRVLATATPCPSFDECHGSCAGLATGPSPFRRSELPPSVPIDGTCLNGHEASNYVLPEERLVPGQREELHVIGVYEGRGNPGFRDHEQRVVDVTVRQRPQPVVLALSARENMLWRLRLEPGARLSRVILQGAGTQEVTGVPEEVPVQVRGPDEVCGVAWAWEARHDGDGTFEPMMRSLRRATGLIETSFQGCYAGHTFEVPHWSGEPPPLARRLVAGDETLDREAVPFPGCEAVTAESQYCLTTTDGSIALLGLDSGRLCPLTSTSAGVGSALHSPSIAWRGELMYACTAAGLARISIRDGTWESSEVPCGGVTNFEGGLLVAQSSPGWLRLRAYADYPAVLDDRPWRDLPPLSELSGFAVDGQSLYSAFLWLGDQIQVTNLSGEAERSIRLAGPGSILLGLAVIDNQLVISNAGAGANVRVVDATTGAPLRDVHPPNLVFGLSCVSGADSD